MWEQMLQVMLRHLNEFPGWELTLLPEYGVMVVSLTRGSGARLTSEQARMLALAIAAQVATSNVDGFPFH